jgi:hypothetical protein
MGIVLVAACAARAEAMSPVCRDHADFPLSQFGGQSGEATIISTGPAVLDGHILTVDVTGFLQAIAKRGGVERVISPPDWD